MTYLRSALSVFSAPLIYGLLCVPLVQFLLGQFPGLLNEEGGTAHVPLLLGTELVQLVVLCLCGYVTAALAPTRVGLHVGISVVLMLAIAVSVQLGYWHAVPVWHHYVFFASVLLGICFGACIRQRQSSGESSAR